MMAVVQSLYFAGREIPIRGGAIDGDPVRTWRLVAWATAAESTLPPDGWVEVATEAGKVVAWGTLIDQTRDESAAPIPPGGPSRPHEPGPSGRPGGPFSCAPCHG